MENLSHVGRLDPLGVYDDGTLHLLLGLSQTALVNARRAGEIRHTRKGHRTLYLGQWVLDWLESTSQQDSDNRGAK